MRRSLWAIHSTPRRRKSLYPAVCGRPHRRANQARILSQRRRYNLQGIERRHVTTQLDLFASGASNQSPSRATPPPITTAGIQNRHQARNSDPEIGADPVENLAGNLISTLCGAMIVSGVILLRSWPTRSPIRVVKPCSTAFTPGSDRRAAGQRLETAPIATPAICSFRLDRHGPTSPAEPSVPRWMRPPMAMPPPIPVPRVIPTTVSSSARSHVASAR